MINLLLVGQEEGYLSNMPDILGQYENVSVLRADSCEVALDLIHYQKVDFVIVDEQLKNTTGLQLVKEPVAVNPMINYALVSPMTVEDFHEAIPRGSMKYKVIRQIVGDAEWGDLVWPGWRRRKDSPTDPDRIVG